MDPSQAAALAKADYTQNGAAYNSGGTPMLGVTPNTYSYLSDGQGGYNYYQNGNTPITREQYSSLSGNPYPTGSVLDATTSSPATPASDPYAAYGGLAAYNSRKAGLDAQRAGIDDSVNQAENQSGLTYKNGILDFVDQLKANQHTIDNAGRQAELAKYQGMNGITNMVGDGIRSSGIMLGNKNAGTSSAADALARAYSLLGARQAQGVGTQYGMDMNNVNDQQNQLNTGVQIQGRKNEETKQNSINSIVGDATNRLSYLDSQIAGANMPDRINLEAEKEKIKQATLAQLSQYDHLFGEGVAGVKPTSQEDRIGGAVGLANSGVGADNPFKLTAMAPPQLQGSGPTDFGSNLPLFTLPRNKQLA